MINEMERGRGDNGDKNRGGEGGVRRIFDKCNKHCISGSTVCKLERLGKEGHSPVSDGFALLSYTPT